MPEKHLTNLSRQNHLLSWAFDKRMAGIKKGLNYEVYNLLCPEQARICIR